MTETPTLNGQDIGQAHLATRALLERFLAQTGISFNSSVTLNQLAGTGSPIEENDLVSTVAAGLKVDPPAVRTALTQLSDRGLISRTADGTSISLTPAGTAQFQEIRQAIAGISERLYGDLPTEDLVVAHRVLVTVTGRANAELAG